MTNINDARFTNSILYNMLHSIDIDSLKPEFRDECRNLKLPVYFNKYMVGSQQATEKIKAMEALIGKEDAEEAYFLGLQFLFSAEESESLKWLEMASDLGISDASYALAMGYSFGSNVGIVKKRDNQKLRFYLDRALEQNPDNAGALNFLGMMRMDDFEDLPADLQFAFECFTKSAALGNPTALFNLSNFYYDGIVVDEDVDKVLEMLKQSANAGEIIAVEALAILYRGYDKVPYDENEFRHWNNLASFGELDKDPAHVKEFNETKELAEKGDPKAQYEMYRYYDFYVSDSKVVYPDPEIAQYWLAKAAAQDYPPALHSIGLKQLDSDPVSAVASFRKGAELGDAPCMKELSDVLFKGKRPYVSQNTKEAVCWGEKYFDLTNFCSLELEKYYVRRKQWDKYLDYHIKYANGNLRRAQKKENELGDRFDAWVTSNDPYYWVVKVGKFYLDGGASYPEGFVVEQSYEKALERFSKIPEKYQRDYVKEYIKTCKSKLKDK